MKRTSYYDKILSVLYDEGEGCLTCGGHGVIDDAGSPPCTSCDGWGNKKPSERAQARQIQLLVQEAMQEERNRISAYVQKKRLERAGVADLCAAGKEDHVTEAQMHTEVERVLGLACHDMEHDMHWEEL